jgi:hypothetical protein
LVDTADGVTGFGVRDCPELSLFSKEIRCETPPERLGLERWTARGRQDPEVDRHGSRQAAKTVNRPPSTTFAI